MSWCVKLLHYREELAGIGQTSTDSKTSTEVLSIQTKHDMFIVYKGTIRFLKSLTRGSDCILLKYNMILFITDQLPGPKHLNTWQNMCSQFLGQKPSKTKPLKDNKNIPLSTIYHVADAWFRCMWFPFIIIYFKLPSGSFPNPRLSARYHKRPFRPHGFL